MAASTGKVLCRYFMSGCCKYGSQCPFSHEWTDKPNMACRYYLKGQCVYGDKCRYDHKRPKDATEAKKSVISPVSLPTASSSYPFTPSQRTQGLVMLGKDPSRNPKKWAQAAEFVPGNMFHGETDQLPHVEASLGPEPQGPMLSYSEMTAGAEGSFLDVITADEAASLLCPFAEMGQCPFGEECEYLHGDLCDMCNRQCLNPFDPEQQKAHKTECLEMHEREMERAFQLQETEGKKCAICLEYISGKLVKSEQRFGILPNCEHCFCLGCIRKWRQTTHAQKITIRACPLCRTISYFVIPSEVWIDDPDQKTKLIDGYKGNLLNKHCKFFDMGKGTCSFGSSCFYKHEYPDGTVAKDEPRFFTDADGARKPIKKSTLWDFLNDHEEQSLAAPQPSTVTSSTLDDGSNSDTPRRVLEDVFGDRELFWDTSEPDAAADGFDDFM